ncbi:unnamed protein product [marine sediment metagenome]|uniref:Large polyvalent protein associated domain-containing protein n=1 Tax=marine sediment metagenome TaxID=412755 RepID=X1NBT8_9ZZZZ
MSVSVSIQFKNGDKISAALFSSFYGERLKKEADYHATWVKAYLLEEGVPLDTLDPGVVMVDFIRDVIIRKKMTRGIFSLGKDGACWDHCERGNHIIDFEKLHIRQTRSNVQRNQDVKDAAKELRKELKEKFLETKFSVRICRWASGEGIFIKWEGLPLKEQVRENLWSFWPFCVVRF